MTKEARANRNEGVAEGLPVFLADTYVLMGKTQACHWNVTGPNFHGLHALFEAQYNDLFQAVDDLAERIRALGHPAPMGIGEMLRAARIEEAKAASSGTAMVKMLAGDHVAMSAAAKELAEQAGEETDLATHDMLVARIIVHDKAAWLLRSHVA